MRRRRLPGLPFNVRGLVMVVFKFAVVTTLRQRSRNIDLTDFARGSADDEEDKGDPTAQMRGHCAESLEGKLLFVG